MRRTAALLALCLSGCWTGQGGSSSGPPVIVPGLPPLVVSAPDSFSVVPLGPVHNGVYDYAWSCSSSQANVTIAGIAGGSLRIEIEDDAGVVVHDNWCEGGLIGAISAITSPDGEP